MAHPCWTGRWPSAATTSRSPLWHRPHRRPRSSHRRWNSCSTASIRSGRSRCPEGGSCRGGTALEGQLLAGFEQRLEAAQNLAPAAARSAVLALAPQHRGPERLTTDIVGDRHLRDAATDGFDLEREPGEAL